MQNKKQSTGSSRKENSYINVVSEENIPAFVFNNYQQPAQSSNLLINNSRRIRKVKRDAFDQKVDQKGANMSRSSSQNKTSPERSHDIKK